MAKGGSRVQVLWMFLMVFVSCGCDYIVPDEPTYDGYWDALMAYMNYEEPHLDAEKAVTATDFGDDHVGFQTAPSIAREIGWDLTGFGEVPYAAMLTNELTHDRVPTSRERYCMGVYVTVLNIVVPCSCVRTYIFKAAKTPDPLASKPEFLFDDLGDQIRVVGDQIEYKRKRLGSAGAYNYPCVSKVNSSRKCFEVFNSSTAVPVQYNLIQRMYPAIVTSERGIRTSATLEWPPLQLNYYTNLVERQRKDGTKWYSYASAINAPYGEIVSYFYHPRGPQSELSRDNFNYRDVIIRERLAALRVKFCHQEFCNNTEEFQVTNQFLKDQGFLWDMPCWCDFIDLPDLLPRLSVQDAHIPHYMHSVHGGLIGAPIFHKGSWVAWIVNFVNSTTDHDRGKDEDEDVIKKLLDKHTRGTWSRSVNEEIVEYIETEIPELQGGNRPNNLDNTRNFLIRDNNIFLPDSDFKQGDFDLAYWNKIGWRRQYKRAWEYSKSSWLLPAGWPVFSSTILFLHL